MRELLIVFFILVLIIMAMAFPFKTRVMTHINLLNTQGYYSFKVMRIRLLTGRFYIDGEKGFSVENANDLVTANYNKPFVKELVKQFAGYLDVKKVEMFFTGGFVNDSYSSAIICGVVSSIIQTVYSYFSEKYVNVKLYEDVEVTFNETNLELTADIVISISLFSILKSIIKANKLAKVKGENNER